MPVTLFPKNDNKFNAYISKYFTTKSGIVKNIPIDKTITEMNNEIIFSFPISDIIRLTKETKILQMTNYLSVVSVSR